MICDRIEHAFLYRGIGRGLDRALSFLQGADFSQLQTGRYELEGRIFYLVQRIETREFSETRWEYHKKYIDIQFALSDGERIGWLPAACLEGWGPYSGETDAAFSGDQAAGVPLDMKKGMFAVFFPTEAHRPCQAPEQCREIVKVVIKVPV